MATLTGCTRTTTEAPRRPLLVWDGDCDLCAAWMERFRSRIDAHIDTIPYQELGARAPLLSESQCARAVHLVGPGGRVSAGAAAVYEALAIAGRRRGLWLYRHVPGFAALSEYLYRQVARRRRII